MDTALLDYAEKAGEENIKFHIECAECISKEANTTLTLLLAGGGTALGYMMKIIEAGNHPVLLGGVIAVTSYLFVLAFTLVWMVMMVEDMDAPTNEPSNLLLPDYALEVVREVELENLQRRIVNNVARNTKKGGRLNRLRLAVIFLPAVFATGLTFGLIFS